MAGCPAASVSTPASLTPEELAEFLNEDREIYSKLVSIAGIKKQ
jgi:hypothetical protein